MRRREPVEVQRAEVLAELLHYQGKSWDVEALTAWLRARARWREVSALPLPAPYALERAALRHLNVPRDLIEADLRASERSPHRPQRSHLPARSDPTRR